MCLLAFAWNVHSRWRLVMAGNRDEFHARPTAALARWPDGLLAGRDLRSGGTWMGLAPGGRAAVVTNVRNLHAPGPEGLSRGGLPAGFLAGDAAASEHTEALAPDGGRYSPFNLVLADAEACVYVGNRPAPGRHRVDAGVHGLSNGGFDAGWPKVARLRDCLQSWVDAGDADLQPLWDALADERIAPDTELPDTGVGLELERRLSAAFIRGSDYGTRASTLIAIDHAGRGFIHERRFGPGGAFTGQTVLRTPPEASTKQSPLW